MLLKRGVFRGLLTAGALFGARSGPEPVVSRVCLGAWRHAVA